MSNLPISLKLNNKDLSLKIRKSNRAKRLSIQLNSASEALIIVPSAAKAVHIQNFLNRSEPWLIKNHAKLLANQDQQVSPPIFTPDTCTIAIFGKMQQLKIKRLQTSRYQLEKKDDGYTVCIPQHRSAEHDRTYIAAALKSELVNFVSEALKKHQKSHQLYPKSVRLKTQKTRWGSCSNLGNINLNWRLIHAPKIVIEYVLVHELCHLRHPNHSAQFWELVAAHMPDYANHRLWLRNNGATLMTPVF